MFVGSRKANYVAVLVFGIGYAVVVGLTTDSYYQLILTLVPIWAVMGLSWNMFSGYSGLVSFGHAVFFGLGAYTTTLLFTEGGITPWIGIPAAAVVGGLAGLLIGAITFRLRGHYFALAMLAYPLAILYVFEWAGYQEVSLPIERQNPLLYMQFSDHRLGALVALALLILIMFLSVHLERSRFGLSLLSVKQNELAAEAAGIDSYRCKLRAITLSGAVAGVAGGLYAVVLLVVTPSSVFGMPVSAQALIVTMFGGVGTVWGAVAGAVILVPLAEILHAELGSVLPGVQGVVFGFAIILVVLTMPQGVVWAFRDRFARPFAKPLLEEQSYRAEAKGGHTVGERVLEVRNLSRRFGGLMAVDNVGLAVARQEIVGIIGPNGAGKTTLFNLLNGLVAADSGHVRLGDADLVGLRPSRICRLGVGRTFQVVRPFPRMTLFQNVLVGALVKASSDAEAREATIEAVRRVGIEPLRDTPASELSNYELRLMELARALAPRPEIMLLDEPFAGLAASEVESLMQLIRLLRADGLSIAIIEHTMHAMVKLVDRFVVLDRGEVIAEGAPEAVVKDPTVIRAYLGEKWKTDAFA